MAATVVFSESNGAGPTVTDSVARGDWLSADSVGDSDKRNTYPLTKPGAGNTYSYEKYNRAKCTALGGSTRLYTFRHYLVAAPPSGWTVQTSAQTGTPSNPSYVQPVATNSTVANQAMPTTDPAAANIAGDLTATGYTGYVVTQADLDTTPTAGFDATVRWKYAEVA